MGIGERRCEFEDGFAENLVKLKIEKNFREGTKGMSTAIGLLYGYA